MKPTFPYPCSRCGFCCVVRTCPVGQEVYGNGKPVCPGLSFQGETATCEIALVHPEAIGVGAGCCIKARIFRRGIEYDFAALSPVYKKSIVRALRAPSN